MAHLTVFQLFQKRALVTRESARDLRSAVQALVSPGERELAIDFVGVEAVTPSFIDELLTMIEELLGTEIRIVFLNPPTRLSEKFAAIARAHEVQIKETDGAWEIRPPSAA